MAALDYKEIPEAGSGPERDRFELFAREFLISEGFRIAEHPNRGADGGRDLIVEEESGSWRRQHDPMVGKL